MHIYESLLMATLVKISLLSPPVEHITRVSRSEAFRK